MAKIMDESIYSVADLDFEVPASPARAIAGRYRLTIDLMEDGRHVVRCRQWPGIRSIDRELGKAIESIRDDLTRAVSDCLHRQETAPMAQCDSQQPLRMEIEQLQAVDVVEDGSAQADVDDATLMNVAKDTAGRYRIELEQQGEEIVVACCEVNGIACRGNSIGQAADRLRERLTQYAMSMLRNNQMPAESMQEIEARRVQNALRGRQGGAMRRVA